jgi:hypothetical protein
MFVTADQIQARIERAFGSDDKPLSLDAAQRTIISQCTDDAYWTVIGALTGRHRLSRAQADAWPLGAKYQRSIAFFYAVKALGFYKPIEPGAQNPLDRYDIEDELFEDSLPLLDAAGGALTSPRDPTMTISDLDEINDDLGIE